MKSPQTVNTSLIFRYFVHNHRRTVTAIKILSIGIIAISGTIQMVNVLSSQIDNIAVLPTTASSNTIHVLPDEGFFSDNLRSQLLEIAERYRVKASMFMSVGDAILSQNNVSYPLPITIVNISKFLPSVFPLYNNIAGLKGNNSGIYIDQMNVIDLGEQGIFLDKMVRINSGILEKNISTNVYSQINSGEFFGLLFDISVAGNFTENQFLMRTSQQSVDKPLIEALNELSGIKIQLSNGKDRFIQASAIQIVRIMYYLYLMISVLSFMSIAILIKNIIDESEEEIRVMKSIGFTNFQLVMLFAGQASLIGLIGSVFGVLVSFIFVNSAFSLLTLLGIGIFIPSKLYLIQALQRIMESQIIAVGAAIIPIYNRFWRR